MKGRTFVLAALMLGMALIPIATVPMPVQGGDYIIIDDAWWTTAAAGSGLADGSSFANRMPIPLDIDHLYISIDENLTVVLESRSWNITLGHGVNAGKNMIVYGGFYTVDGNNEFNASCPYRLSVGGTITQKEGDKRIYGEAEVFNVDWGQDPNGIATNNEAYGFEEHSTNNYYENCTFKDFNNGAGYYINGGYYKDCTFHGTNNGTGYCIYLDATINYFENCTFNTSGSYTFRYPEGRTYFIGNQNFTQPNYYHLGNNYWKVYYMQRAYLRVVDDGGNPVENASFNAEEAEYSEWMMKTGGFTDSNGYCRPMFPERSHGSIACLNNISQYAWAGSGAHSLNAPLWKRDYGNYTFTVSADGYQWNSTTHDFTDDSDWGNATNPIDFELEPIPTGTPFTNMTLRTYDDNTTTTVTSRFDLGATAYINGTIEIDTTVNNANVNVTVRRGTTGAVTGWLLNTTHNFIANVEYNLTEIAGDVLNYTSATGGQYYVQVDVWKTGELAVFNETEDLIFRDISGPTTGGGPGGAVIHAPTTPTAEGSDLDVFLGQAGIYISDNIAQMLVLAFLLVLGVILIWYNKKKKRRR